MTELLCAWLTPCPALLALGVVAWAIATARRNVGLVDVFWSLFFLLGAGVRRVRRRRLDVRALLVLVLVAAWALRLATYLARAQLERARGPPLPGHPRAQRARLRLEEPVPRVRPAGRAGVAHPRATGWRPSASPRRARHRSKYRRRRARGVRHPVRNDRRTRSWPASSPTRRTPGGSWIAASGATAATPTISANSVSGGAVLPVAHRRRRLVDGVLAAADDGAPAAGLGRRRCSSRTSANDGQPIATTSRAPTPSFPGPAAYENVSSSCLQPCSDRHRHCRCAQPRATGTSACCWTNARSAVTASRSTTTASERELRSEAASPCKFLVHHGLPLRARGGRALAAATACASLDVAHRRQRQAPVVSAAARGGDFRVRSTGSAMLDGCVMSFAYWNPQILQQQRAAERQTGEIVPVTCTDLGEEIDHGARPNRVRAQRYRLSARSCRSICGTPTGEWVALESPAKGGRRPALRTDYESRHDSHWLMLAALFLAGCRSTPYPPLALVPQRRPPALHGRLVRDRQHPDLHREGRAQRGRVVPARCRRHHRDHVHASAPAASTARQKRYTRAASCSDGDSNAVWGMQFIWPIKADYRIVYLDSGLHADRDRPREARLRVDHGAHAADPRCGLRAAARSSWPSRATTMSQHPEGAAALELNPQPTRSRSLPRHHALTALVRLGGRAGRPARGVSTGCASLPFIALHLACLGVIWVGWSPVAVAVAVALYALRMFAITGFYHRYFSHRAFRTSRAMQFAVRAARRHRGAARAAVVGGAPPPPPRARRPARATRTRRGSDGFLWSHVGWFLTRENFRTAHASWCRTWRAIPELRFLDRFDVLVPLLLAVALYGSATGWRRARARHQRLADAGLGLLHLDRRALPRDLHHQLARAPLRHAALRDARRQPQQPAGSRCSPSARAGTTTTTTTRRPRARASAGGRSTSAYYVLRAARRRSA